MAVLGHQTERKPFLPHSVQATIRRLIVKLLGAGALALTVACWLALVSWSITDPSLNNATGDAPRNWLGAWGATAADLIMQSVGLAAIVLFVPMAAWGWRLFSAKIPANPWWRLLAWPAAALCIAAALSCLPAPANWPLPNGLGGIMGDVVMSALYALIPAPKVLIAFAGGLALFALGSLGTLFASAISLQTMAGIFARDETSNGDAMAATLGGVIHWALAKRAQIARMIAPGRRAMTAQPPEGDHDAGHFAPAHEAEHAPPGQAALDANGRIEPYFEEPGSGALDEDGYTITRTAEPASGTATITASRAPAAVPSRCPQSGS